MLKKLSDCLRRHTFLCCVVLTGMLVLSVVAGISLGTAKISFSTVWRIILHNLFGLFSIDDIKLSTLNIVWRIRIPRALLGMVVGGSLTLSGISMQAFTKNPLAEPYVLGISSGASTGGHEACEKRDGDPARYGGKGVRSAVRAVNDELARALIGRDAAEQKTIDRILCETDGTGDKSNLGANAILGVSLAVAHAAAAACRLPLWQYLTRFTGRRPALPRPMMNILNGGRHAPNNIDIQEFMVIPLGCPTFADGLERCVRVTHRLGALLEEAGLACGVGDEGGFAPQLKNEEQALELILRAIEDCRLRPGEDMALALDAAAGEWQTGNNMYLLPKENRLRTPHDLLEYWRRLTAKYPIISLEDPAGEDDWDLWRQLTEAIGKNVQLVGDDLFVTQKARLEQGLARRAANAVLIKPNQVGTLTETLETVALAQQSGYGAILSHRSGETEDTTIADLAVATACGQIKTGAPCRSERTAKYNRLLRIEAMLEEMV